MRNEDYFNIINENLPQVSLTTRAAAAPVALVSMPWGSITKPSLALPLLKSCLHKAGFRADVFLLNMWFAECVGLDLYERMADLSLHPEWFFSADILEVESPERIRIRLEALKKTMAGRRLLDCLLGALDGSEDLLIRTAVAVPNFLNFCLAEIDWSRYMVVGFTTTFAQSFASVALSKKIKDKFPHVKIIFGGANVDSEMGVEWMHAFEWIDYVAHGESEHSLIQLLDNLVAGAHDRHVPGISMRTTDGIHEGYNDQREFIDMNAIPSPDYSDYVRELKRTKFDAKEGLRLFVESSRGCWWGMKHHCTFCGLNGSGMSYRKKEARHVYAELLELSRKYHCLSFAATDNILPHEYYSQLLPDLAAADMDIRLFYEVKANQSWDQLKLLSESGVKSIQPGIESFNSRLLTLMRKGVKAIQNIQLLKWCMEIGIDPAYNILVGFPGEGPDDYSEYPNLFRLLFHLRPPGGIYSVLFERFSPYHYERDKFGLTLRPLSEYTVLFENRNVSLDRIAYFFEGEWVGQRAPVAGYTSPIRDAWKLWKEHWSNRKVKCFYLKGPGYLTIYDNRPGFVEGALQARRLNIEEPAATMYMYCDENRSFQSIREHVKQTLGSVWDEKKLRDLLDQLVEHGLMYREENRYLALAVREGKTEKMSVAVNFSSGDAEQVVVQA